MNSNKYITNLLCLMIFLGCSNSISKKAISKQSTIKNISELTSYQGKKIEFKEYPCEESIGQAEKDLINGNLYYFDLQHFDFHRSNKEMAIILKFYNIELFESYSYSNESGESNCYEIHMNKSITEKYGSFFIDSLRNIAEVKYVKNNPERIYLFEECDTTSRYLRADSYEDFFYKYKYDFFEDFDYPASYQFNEGKYSSYTSAEFILNKDSSIQIIKIETEFQNSENEIHRNLFDKRVKNFIEKSKWLPAKSAGIVINSIVSLTFHYK